MCKKRKIYTMSELNLALMKCFNTLNEHYFNGELEKVVLTFESGYKKGAYGWIETVKDWKQGKEERYHINISSDFLDRLPVEIVATLLHEMCHLYALQNNIKDTSRSGIYHNKAFAKIANEHGLVAVPADNVGYMTHPSEALTQWVNDNCPFSDILLMKKRPIEITGKSDKPKQSSRKYICPSCGLIARATKDCRLQCIECKKEMVLNP